MENLPFDQRACFIAGAAKSGTSLLVSLLDSHPELLVMPQDTAYFATVLTKYRDRGAAHSSITWSMSPGRTFSSASEPGAAIRTTPVFRKRNFFRHFERMAFDPANAERDLLALMMEAYARRHCCSA